MLAASLTNLASRAISVGRCYRSEINNNVFLDAANGSLTILAKLAVDTLYG